MFDAQNYKWIYAFLPFLSHPPKKESNLPKLELFNWLVTYSKYPMYKCIENIRQTYTCVHKFQIKVAWNIWNQK